MENYIVSARKYRPSTFESVVGQRALTETLRNAIRSSHLANAYLFCGPRGVGKTTCARIFAKTINCLNPTESHDACNECESCRAFNEQRSFNIHELDAASHNSVDDIRQLIQEVRIPPQVGYYSVYIIDEVHMLSAGAFNALLKTLEEPPSYAIFILATTEKHKVLPTILSRCQVYDFSRITIADTIAHLRYVAQQEGITIGDEALNVIAQKADGGMRDALSIFDQLVSFSGKEISYERAIEVLNVLDSEYYFRLLDCAQQCNHSGALLLLNEVLQKGFDAQHFLTGFAQHLRDVLVSKDASTVQLLETSDAIRTRYQQASNMVTAQWLFKALDLVNTTDVQYRTAKNKRLTVELGLIKLCQLNAVSAAQPVVASAPASAPGNPVRPVEAPAAPKPAPAVAPARPTEQVSQKASGPQMPRIPSIRPGSLPSLGKNPVATATNPAESKPEQTTAPLVENRPFTPDQLLRAWLGLKEFYKNEARLKALMDEHVPEIKEGTLCVVRLANVWQKEVMAEYSSDMVMRLRQKLQNTSIRLTLEVQEYEHVHHAYTQEEKYKVLVEMNPVLADLKDSMSLQLE